MSQHPSQLPVAALSIWGKRANTQHRLWAGDRLFHLEIKVLWEPEPGFVGFCRYECFGRATLPLFCAVKKEGILLL